MPGTDFMVLLTGLSTVKINFPTQTIWLTKLHP